MVAVPGNAMPAVVKSAPGLPIPAAGGIRVAVKVNVALGGITQVSPCSVIGVLDCSAPPEMRKPAKLPSAIVGASNFAKNHTLPGPSVRCAVGKMPLWFTGKTPNGAPGAPKANLCDTVSGTIMT